MLRTLSTASRAYGMYDILYQVIATNCIAQHRKVRPVFLRTSADTSVNTKNVRAAIVAITLVELNIFLSCLTGPMRKQVLAIEVMLPRE